MPKEGVVNHGTHAQGGMRKKVVGMRLAVPHGLQVGIFSSAPCSLFLVELEVEREHFKLLMLHEKGALDCLLPGL